jgi:phosphoenolpyruvate---glycerone phosphotransferase subunit DhaL
MRVERFDAVEGARIVSDMIRAVQENKQRLSDIDGAIGDGDHGVNMSKGFTLAEAELGRSPGDLSHGLEVISRTLMTSIGGAMGPLYGMLFRGMARAVSGVREIDAAAFGRMLSAGLASVRGVSDAQVGDKTLMDALVPAVEAFQAAHGTGAGYRDCLAAAAAAAEEGRDSTLDLEARVGRASRLGKRSRGALDAGATSCALILRSLCDGAALLIRD